VSKKQEVRSEMRERINPGSVHRLCGLLVRVPGYSSRGPGSIPGATKFFLEIMGL
jgi:hypothetical protein